METSDSESNDDSELVCCFPVYQQSNQRAIGMNPDAEPFVPVPVRRERELVQGRVEADFMDNTAGGDGEDNTAEPGESLQESSEELASEVDDPEPPPATHRGRDAQRPRMLTYGALGEPTLVEVGVKNLQVSMFPDCKGLWRPWMAPGMEVTS